MSANSCDCIARMNEALKPRNCKLARAFVPKGNSIEAFLLVSTEPLGPKKRGEKFPHVMATYCPFCGQKDAKT